MFGLCHNFSPSKNSSGKNYGSEARDYEEGWHYIAADEAGKLQWY